MIHLPLPAGVKDWEKLPHSLYHLRRAAEISVNLITGSHHPQREVTAEVEITGGCYIKRDSVRVFKDSPPAYRGSLSPFDSSFEKKMWQELQQALKHRTYSWIDYYDQGGGSKS